MPETLRTAPARPRGRVLYDGACPLCRRSIALLRKLDWFGRLEYVDVRDSLGSLLCQEPVASAPLLEQMHLLTPDGRWHRGFEAFRWLAWRLPALWPLAPLLYLPGVPWLGQRCYLWIARNRFHLVPCRNGVCDIQKHR